MKTIFRPIRRLIGAGILAFNTALIVVLAKFAPKFWFSFYTDFSRGAMYALGRATAWIPFPLWEILLALLVLAIPVGLIYAICKARFLGWLTALLEGVCLLAFLFMGLWGLNHFAPSLAEQTGLEVRAYTKEELQQALTYYAKQASLYSTQVERDAEGNVIVPEISELAEEAARSYEALGRENARYQDPVPTVKPLLVSDAFAYMGTTGVYICFTGEAGVSTSNFALDQPFTVCHEMGHSLAFAAEDEANYCGFLACRTSEDPLFRYSGYYNALIYCYNALHREDAKAAERIWSENCSEEVNRDSRVHVEYNKQYEGKTQQTTQKVYDKGLKLVDERGVRSYGLVTDYLIADYLQTQNP